MPRQERVRPQTFEEQLYAAVVRAGDVCFDVGANVGTVTLFLARLTGPEGEIVAFEPVPEVYDRLCANLRADPHPKAPIVPVCAGLAEVERVATIQVPARDFERGSLAVPDAWRSAQQGAEITSYDCDFVTFDRFLEANRRSVPDFMKIDVEGAELGVLRGAAGHLAQGARPLMLVELFAPWERAFGYGPWEVLSLLRGWGYRMRFACPGGLVAHEPSPTDPFPPEFEQGYNVLAFVPDRHAGRVRALDRLLGGGGQQLPMPPPPLPNR